MVRIRSVLAVAGAAVLLLGMSYALSHRGSRGARYWDAQICGRALDTGPVLRPRRRARAHS